MDDHPDYDDHEWQAVAPPRAARIDEQSVRAWGLVLTARFIPNRIEHTLDGWQLLTPTDLLPRATDELRFYEAENRNWPPVAPPYRPVLENSLATLSVLFFLATFHNITRLKIPLFNLPPPDWLDIGSAKVHLIHYGQWWRLMTALTLHADWLHLLSNLTIGGFFVLLLCRELGSGLGWFLLLAAGSLGNWANAQVQLPTHSSVGASTAVFAAVGILAAINLVRYRQNRLGRWRLIVAAALALLTLLGTEGANTDLGAHFFGFLFGVGLGLTVESQIARKGRPGFTLNALLALTSGLLVAAAWSAALLYSG